MHENGYNNCGIQLTNPITSMEDISIIKDHIKKIRPTIKGPIAILYWTRFEVEDPKEDKENKT